jgi:hypothetical protein
VAKIVHHYGSEVTMELGGETYDAGTPLELFRANEKINAEKRRRLADEIGHMNICNGKQLDQDMVDAVQQIIHTLADKRELVIYERPLPLEELQPDEGESLAQFAVDEIARLLAHGKIDIVSEISVTFEGDRQVLDDLELLAENGYGEDNFGNNIPLPEQLRYLRR